tara:strand:+ start:921 stop:2198 length:1278 start_codon:yes stop_codon:yes gene_type:complete
MKSIFIKTWKLTSTILLLSILLFCLVVNTNIFGSKNKLYKKYPNLEKKFAMNLFNQEPLFNNLENDYNVKFLPKTQFTNINFKKIKLNFKPHFSEPKAHTFFLELKGDDIWIIDKEGIIFKTSLKSINQKKHNETLELSKVRSNLNEIKILDAHVNKDDFYIYFIEDINNCKTINISVAKIKNDNLKFEKFFNSDECQENEIQIGRLITYTHEDKPGLLVATNFFIRDEPKKYLSQDDKSIFGKILFIDLENSNQIVFSKGHRAPQGLYVEKDLILSTEHGPKGGDEINKIIFGENYGWPLASYGDYYMETKTDSDLFSEKPYYLKDHKSNGFKEPIFSFLPAIGISEIIRLPNNFSKHFIDNFIVTSLNGKSIFRIKFDDEYNKIVFFEKIFIGERIRDIKYHYTEKKILLALEYNGEIAILTK